MSNTRWYHSIGLKVKEKLESNPGRQSDDRMRENSRGKTNLKRWVLSFERNVETDNELRVYMTYDIESGCIGRLQYRKNAKMGLTGMHQ